MYSSSRGIATTVLVIAVVAIIAVAGAAVYLSGALTPASTGTHSSTSTSTPSGSSSTSSASSSSSSSSSSPSTSTSSTSSTSFQSTTSTASTFSCTSTYSTTSGTQVDYTPQYISLVAKFSAITFAISSNTNGTAQNSTLSYHAATVSSGIYDVNITVASSSTIESSLVRVDSNNESVISATISGHTFYGAQAKSFFDVFMALFGLEETYGGNVGLFTSAAYFHSTGTAQMTFGTTSFDVTTWVANSLPLSVDQCGYSAMITAYTIEVGTPPGTSLTFITLLHIATSSPQNEDITFNLVSMTVA